MNFHRPRSLNGLILVGFSLVALPLLIAVIWALVNLDRLAEQSEQLVATGVSAAENNRLLVEQLGALERVARQYEVLGNPESLQLMQQDLGALRAQLATMQPLAERAGVTALAAQIQSSAATAVAGLAAPESDSEAIARSIAIFTPLRQQVGELTTRLTAFVDTELMQLQESTRRAQRISAWQVAALVPGTLVLVLFFILLVAKPIRQLDAAIHQLAKADLRSRSRSRARPTSNDWAASSSGCGSGSWNWRRRKTSSCGTCRMN